MSIAADGSFSGTSERGANGGQALPTGGLAGRLCVRWDHHAPDGQPADLNLMNQLQFTRGRPPDRL